MPAEDVTQETGFGVSMPMVLGIWLVCIVIAALVWSSITSNAAGAQTPGFGTLLALGAGFGFGGAALVCLAVDIIRRQ